MNEGTLILSSKLDIKKQRSIKLKKNDIYIFGHGVNKKSFTFIKEEKFKHKISKITFGENHFVILFGNFH